MKCSEKYELLKTLKTVELLSIFFYMQFIYLITLLLENTVGCCFIQTIIFKNICRKFMLKKCVQCRNFCSLRYIYSGRENKGQNRFLWFLMSTMFCIHKEKFIITLFSTESFFNDSSYTATLLVVIRDVYSRQTIQPVKNAQ